LFNSQNEHFDHFFIINFGTDQNITRNLFHAQKGFREYIDKEKPDIICLQETKVGESEVDANYLPGYTAYFYACKERPGYAGTAYFISFHHASFSLFLTNSLLSHSHSLSLSFSFSQ
jgi:exonuclease III